MINFTLLKLIGVTVIYLFLPITALTYYLFRQQRKTFEVERLLAILDIDPDYKKAHGGQNPGYSFLWSVAYASVVSGLGLLLLFLGAELFPPAGEFASVKFGDVKFPGEGSRLVFGMAFLGAYVWGLQYVFRRYALHDLTPEVYYSLSIRMILASLIAMVIYNAYEALSGGDAEGGPGGSLTSKIWPVLAFLLGMFPQRGLQWLTERLPILSSETSSAVRNTPLTLIEGIESHDKIRLEELGIDTCYDLANADFVPLLLTMPYSARMLVDWILQAKLCVYFGETVQGLRQHSIRTIIDLQQLTAKDIETLAPEIALTKSALERAQQSVQDNMEIERLLQVRQLLGMFSQRNDFMPPST